jgi:hypothetical protein
VIIPPGFFKDHESIEVDSETTAVEVGFASGWRVVYSRNLRGTWEAHTLDLAVFGGGDTLEAAQRTMEEAVAFHLATEAEDAAALGRGRAQAVPA